MSRRVRLAVGVGLLAVAGILAAYAVAGNSEMSARHITALPPGATCPEGVSCRVYTNQDGGFGATTTIGPGEICPDNSACSPLAGSSGTTLTQPMPTIIIDAGGSGGGGGFSITTFLFAVGAAAGGVAALVGALRKPGQPRPESST